MNKLAVIFISGMLISFLGSIPLGAINITAFQFAASSGIADAYIFVTAALIIELIVVYITLYTVNKITISKKVLNYLSTPAILLLAYLAVNAYLSADNNNTEANQKLFPAIHSPFLMGILLSTFNPLQIPFWMTWNGILLTKKKLNNSIKTRTFYIAGIGMGSLAALSLFILAANQLVKNYAAIHSFISYSLSLLYIGLALYLLVGLYKNSQKLQTQ